MKIRLLVAAGAVLLGLAGCTGGEDAPSDGASSSATASPSVSPRAGQISAADGSMSLVAPSDWKSKPDQVRGNGVIAAQGDDPLEQVVVTREDGASTAYDSALFAVTGLQADEKSCGPLTIDKHDAFDCADSYQGQAFHRVFVAVERGDSSYGLLIQTPAKDRKAALAVAEPLVESIRFG